MPSRGRRQFKCIARGCHRRTAPDELLCRACFRAQDRHQVRAYNAMVRDAPREQAAAAVNALLVPEVRQR